MALTPTATASSSPHQNLGLSQFAATSIDSTPFTSGHRASWGVPGGLGGDEPVSSSSPPSVVHRTYVNLNTPANNPISDKFPQFYQKIPNLQMATTPSNGGNGAYFNTSVEDSVGFDYFSPQPGSSASSAFNQLSLQVEPPRQSTGDQQMPHSTGGVSLPGFTSPESAFYQYQNRMEGQLCQICGELAAGFHHGAYVCEACKKFFMRHSLANGRSTTTCPTGGNCVISKSSRGRCQQCRYKKCLDVGMSLKDVDAQSEFDISNIPCRVCGGRSSGFHFGALTCEGCKGFFRRTEETASRLMCVGGKDNCTITPRSRNVCKACRFRRCLRAGMSKRGSRIGRQPNAVKFHCAIEIRQLQDSGQLVTGDFAPPPVSGGDGVGRKHSASVPALHHASASTAASPVPSSAFATTASTSANNNFLGGGSASAFEGFPQRRASAGACDMSTYAASMLMRRKISAPSVVGGGSSLNLTTTTTTSNNSGTTTPTRGGGGGGSASDEDGLLDGLNWFNYGMSMTFEYMRLPVASGSKTATSASNAATGHSTGGGGGSGGGGGEGGGVLLPFCHGQFYKSRLRMSRIEAHEVDDEQRVWQHVMNHFHFHSQQVVQFAKLIPGFNQMSLAARGHLVRTSLYSEVLLMLARDYSPGGEGEGLAGGCSNFLDFTPQERDVVLRHFPIYHRVVDHLKVSGHFFYQLRLSHTEFVYACVIGILRNYCILVNPAYTDARKLLLLARHSLLATMRSQNDSMEMVDQRWNRLESLHEMLTSMSNEYREIAQQLQRSRRDLVYPDLYREMYEVSNGENGRYEAPSLMQTSPPVSGLLSQPTSSTNVATSHFPSASTLIPSTHQLQHQQQQPSQIGLGGLQNPVQDAASSHWPESASRIKVEDPGWPAMQDNWSIGVSTEGSAMASVNPYQISNFLGSIRPPRQP